MPRRRPTRTLADVPVRGLREALRTTPTLHAVAQRYGVSDNALRYWCAKLDLARPPPGPGAAHRALLLPALAACPAGATVGELCYALHLTHSACNHALRALERTGQVRRTTGRPWSRGRRRCTWYLIR
jgi:transposase-like protein